MRCHLRREPLPPLFMRFVMQAGFAWPALTPLTVDLLCKLIGKQARLAVTSRPVSSTLRLDVICDYSDADMMWCDAVGGVSAPAGLRSCLFRTEKHVCEDTTFEMPPLSCIKPVTAAQKSRCVVNANAKAPADRLHGPLPEFCCCNGICTLYSHVCWVTCGGVPVTCCLQPAELL